MFHHTSRKTSRRDVEAPESLGSFKVSTSVSEAATSRLGFVSDFKHDDDDDDEKNFERFGLVSVSAQKVSCTSLIIIQQNYIN